MTSTLAEAEYPNSWAPGPVATVGPDLATVHFAPWQRPALRARPPGRRAASRKERNTPTTIERKPVMTGTARVLVDEDPPSRGNKICALAGPTSDSPPLDGVSACHLEPAREAS